MRCSDVINVIDTARRTVGGILNINTYQVKCVHLVTVLTGLYAHHAFRLVHNSTHKHTQVCAVISPAT